MADFSKNLKQLRQAGGMSQAQLAEQMHVTRQTISSWERGNSYPDIGMLTHLAEALGVEVQELLCAPKRRSFGRGELTALSPKFWVLSMLFYFLLFWYGKTYIAFPFFRLFTTVDVYNERFITVYWGLFLVISYIGLCTCILSEYISNTVEILSAQNTAEAWADKPCSN